MKENKLRFILILATLMVFGFLVTSLTSYFAAHNSLSKQISETTLPLTSDNVYSEIQNDLLKPIFISSLMAQDTFVRDWTIQGEEESHRLVRYLAEIQRRYKAVTAFFVSEKTKRYYHPTGVIKTLSPQDDIDKWYYRFRDKGDEYEINVDADTANPGKMTIFINYRVFDYAGNYIGATGVGLSVSKVQNLIKVYQERYGRHVSFVDRQGHVMMSSQNYHGGSIRNTPGLNKIATQILATPSGTFSYQRDGKTVHLNARLVPEFQWYLLVEQEEKIVEGEITQNLFSNLAVSLIICIIVVTLAHFTISRYQNRLEDMAINDKLTNVSNRHMFDVIFDQVERTAKRQNHPVSLVMMDIDHFKTINDTFGHWAGDKVIVAIAAILKERLRDSDSIFRWGGEEFLILLPDCSLERAHSIADDLRCAIAATTVRADSENIAVTASFGVTQQRVGEDSQQIIKRVDKALYEAKDAGRNTIVSNTAV
jgi:diguanylate cyclase (GGDEF)-like protein